LPIAVTDGSAASGVTTGFAESTGSACRRGKRERVFFDTATI